MIKNIIFDWSGVLSDDFELVYKATMNVFKRLGVKTHSVEVHRQKFILPYMDFYRQFTDAPREKIDEMFTEEIHKLEEPKLLPKAKETLEFLYKKGFKMALLSSHSKSKLAKEIKNHKFDKYFVHIYGGVNDKRQVIAKLMKENKFEPGETVYIGDMTHDVESGKKAGTKTVAITWGYESRKKLEKSKPDFIIDKIIDFKKVLKNFEK